MHRGRSVLISQAEGLSTLPKNEEIPSSSSPHLVTDATNYPDGLVITLQDVKQSDCFSPIASFLLTGCWLRSVSGNRHIKLIMEMEYTHPHRFYIQ